MNNRRLALYFALILSLALHGGASFLFLRDTGARSQGRAGVVAIELIQSVHHGGVNEVTLPTHAHELRKRKGDRTQALSSAPTAAGGDPGAEVRAAATFIADVTGIIERSKVYPRESLDRDEEGKVMVALTLDRAGKLLEAKIEQPCPFEMLNRAALRTIQKIPAFPPVPDELSVPVHLHVPLNFRIER